MVQELEGLGNVRVLHARESGIVRRWCFGQIRDNRKRTVEELLGVLIVVFGCYGPFCGRCLDFRLRIRSPRRTPSKSPEPRSRLRI